MVRDLSGPEIKRKRKAIAKLLKECSLNTKIQTNPQIVNILVDETNVDTSTYQTCRKTNNIPVYIDKERKVKSSPCYNKRHI